MLSIFDNADLPWGEIITGIGTLAVLLLGLGNSKLREILDETKSNGGKSLKDQITRIDRNIHTMSLWLEAGYHLEDKKAIFRTDQNGSFVWVNTAFISLTGRSFEELKGLGWISSVHEEDRSRIAKEWESSVQDKRSFEAEFRIVNSYSEEEKFVRGRAVPITDSPSLVGYLGNWIIIEEI
jgi:PAS domain S-box-containing protein